MATVSGETKAPVSPVAVCPWCPGGSRLALRGDGFGGAALWCANCGCKGPTVPIAGDFDEADRAVIARWSQRPAAAAPVPSETVDRVLRAISIAHLLAGGGGVAEGTVSIRQGDVCALLDAAGVRLKH